MDVVEKKASGWWFIENAGSQGWAPAAYLEPVTGGQEDEVEKCAPGNHIVIVSVKVQQDSLTDVIIK